MEHPFQKDLIMQYIPSGIKSNEQFAETDAKNNWINAHFLFTLKKKMFILGEKN
jgi:hypothetical protein